ncbi:MAG TPA: tetratricopeptide repeat protein [Oculatellaceae cyanobacterium]
MQSARIKTIFSVLLLVGTLTGCGDTSNLGAIHDTFEVKPQNYDEMMAAANKLAQSNPTKALYWYQQAIANAEMEYGPNDARIANAAMYDAALARNINQLGEAEKMYKRAYDIQVKLLPAGSPQLKQIAQVYAETLVANYKLDEARKIDPNVRTPADSLKGQKSKPTKKKH